MSLPIEVQNAIELLFAHGYTLEKPIESKTGNNGDAFMATFENKGWKIMSFAQTMGNATLVFPKKRDGWFTNGFDEFPEKELLASKDIDIHSVKRIDGNLFTVEDSFRIEGNDIVYKIKGFEISPRNGNLLVLYENGGVGIKKIKKALPDNTRQWFAPTDTKEVFTWDEVLRIVEMYVGKIVDEKEFNKALYGVKQTKRQPASKSINVFTWDEIKLIINKIADGAKGYDTRNYLKERFYELAKSKQSLRKKPKTELEPEKIIPPYDYDKSIHGSLKPESKERIDVSRVFLSCGGQVNGKDEWFGYQFNVLKSIPSEKFPLIKQAIERVLNNEPVYDLTNGGNVILSYEDYKKLFTKQQLDEARILAFNAAREKKEIGDWTWDTVAGTKIKYWDSQKYPTLQDYLKSLKA